MGGWSRAGPSRITEREGRRGHAAWGWARATSGVTEPSSGWPRTDYAAIFRAMPTPYLVMTPDLVIADANPAYLATTGRTLEDIIGRHVFEAFPGNPNDTDRDGGGAKVRGSFERARDTGLIDTMELQEYDIPDGRGGFDKRFWSLISIPVLGDGGLCRYVIQRAEDIIDYVLDQRGAPDTADRRHGMEWHRRVLEVESDLYARGLELTASREAELATARRLAALAGVALDLAAADSANELTRIVTVSGLEALGAHGAAIGVRDRDVLRLVVTDSLAPWARKRFSEVPLEDVLPFSAAARTGRTVVLPDRAACLIFAPAMAEVVDTTGNEAWVAMPLQAGAPTLGALAVGGGRPQPGVPGRGVDGAPELHHPGHRAAGGLRRPVRAGPGPHPDPPGRAGRLRRCAGDGGGAAAQPADRAATAGGSPDRGPLRAGGGAGSGGRRLVRRVPGG